MKNRDEKIYQLAVTDPEVDALDADEVEEYARQKAKELCLPDPDAVAKRVREIQPTTAEFKKATEHAVEAKDLI